jgi:hypothetical protein
MTTEEIKIRLDGLSQPAKDWLHSACNQIADSGEYIDNEKAHAECEAAGLVETGEDNHLDVEAGVMALVYSDGYLAPIPPTGSVQNSGEGREL